VQAEGAREERCGQSSGIGYCLYPGPSPLLVLLSGLGNDMQDWSPSFLRALNRFAGVLIYDRRGYGESVPLPSQPVTTEAVAADLHELLQTLHIRQPVVLVGHSLGGLYAQYFARNYPQAVEAVVLIDASSPFEPIDDPRFQTRSVLEPGTTDYLENAGFDSSVRQTRESPPFPPVPLLVLTATDHQSPAGFEREWRQIQARTAAQSPLGRQIIVDGSGHYIQDDQPELVVDQIHHLLSSFQSALDSTAAETTASNRGTAATKADDSTACSNATVRIGTDGNTIAQTVEQAFIDNGLASVLYRVTKAGELIAAGALGDSMTGVPADQSMHFRNGNVAFGYMGTLLLLMNENGEVSLDDPVSKWLPDLALPNADKVTLAMLADSTSGYPDYVPNDTFANAFLDDPFKGFTPKDLIDIGLSTPPWYEPGTAWNYAHTNYVILGEALAAAGGKPLGDLLTERVIETIGLTNTAPVITPGMPEPVLHTFSTERDVFEETTFWNPSWQTAPGSVIATNICDMVTSAAAIGTGLLLTNESYNRMIAPVMAQLGLPPASCPKGVCRQLSDTTYYGLGVIIMSDWIVQTPMFGGQGSVHAYLPSEDLAVAIVAVTGQNSKPNTNYAQQIWQSITTELTPKHVPSR